MIKRLRIQFICITMVLMTVLLLTIFSMIYYATWTGMEREAVSAMQSATFEPWRPGGMGANDDNPKYPCFILCMDPFGELSATGHAYYDLSDTQLLTEILQEAQATGLDSGILKDRGLRFLKVELWKMEEYVFTDICVQAKTMDTLVFNCIPIFFIALVVCFGISYLLSRWILRPLERAWAYQKQFVADASHELKTPLTVILTNAEMLDSGEYDAESNRRFTHSILTMSGQMRGLVESLLELAKVDHRRVPQQARTTLDFSELTEDCVMRFEPVYFEADRILESNIHAGIHVHGNRQYLQQVVDILLDNGRKYSNPGSHVELTLENTRRHCQLRVSSHGATLTNKQCRDIFKRFYRVDEARSMNRSYGLGLPIAESIVREHRGKIWAQSKDGVNTFYVTLPRRGKGK